MDGGYVPLPDPCSEQRIIDCSSLAAARAGLAEARAKGLRLAIQWGREDVARLYLRIRRQRSAACP